MTSDLPGKRKNCKQVRPGPAENQGHNKERQIITMISVRQKGGRGNNTALAASKMYKQKKGEKEEEEEEEEY